MGTHYLSTDASCTDDGEEGICFLCYSNVELWEDPLQFTLVFARVTNSIHIHLEGREERRGRRKVTGQVYSNWTTPMMSRCIKLNYDLLYFDGQLL